MKKGNYILWLPSWYPHRFEPLNGDFVQRHAAAVAQYQQVVVLMVILAPQASDIKHTTTEVYDQNNLIEYRVFLRPLRWQIPLFTRFVDQLRVFVAYLSGFTKILRRYGKPLLVHVPVMLRTGWLAMLLAFVSRVPYVITEHWSGWLHKGQKGYLALTWYQRLLARWVFRRAAGVSAVSGSLAQNLEDIFSLPPVSVIPNVVDTERFIPGAATPGKIIFLHISTLDHPKNGAEMLRGFAAFRKQTAMPFELVIVGPERPELRKLAAEIGLAPCIRWEAERPQKELLPLYQAATALVLWSRYETFGCVLIEAQACGKPVLVSDVPVFYEIVEPGINGLIGKGQDAATLCTLLLQFVREQSAFDPVQIRESVVQRFSCATVGSQMTQWYSQVLRRKVVSTVI